MKRLSRGILFISFLFLVNIGSAQDKSVLDTPIQLDKSEYSFREFNDFIYQRHNITLTFDSRFFNPDIEFALNKEGTLKRYLSKFFKGYNHTFIPEDGKRVFIRLAPATKYKVLKGTVVDAVSSEVLDGVLVFDRYNSFSYTKDGAFSIKVPEKLDSLIFSYLGYEDLIVSADQDLNVKLKYVNEFAPVVIKSSVVDEININNGAKIIDVRKERFATQLSHEEDVVKLLKMESGVQSGNEGENGFVVRGGTYDKNLMLLDGVPIQEMNHSLGLSSTLYPSAIKTMSLFKDSAPARYGGRVGAVIDINLSEGNRNKREGEFEMDIKHLSIALNGPLNKKLSYNFYLRESLLDAYLPTVFKSYTTYENTSSISYEDLLGKLTYHINNKSKIEFLTAFGSDDLILSKKNVLISNLNTDVKNNWTWFSSLFSLKYMNVISSKLKLDVQVANTNYFYDSGGSYNFRNLDTGTDNVFSIYSQSTLNNIYANLKFDYYLNDNNTIYAGVDYHNANVYTTILQDTSKFDIGIAEVLNKSNTSPAKLNKNIFAIYVEDAFQYNRKFRLNAGVRATFFDLYYNRCIIQPRFKISYQWTPNYVMLFSMDKNVQFMHSLYNSGVGIPINLFAGSDDRIKPQISNQVNLTHAFDVGSNRIEISGYYKEYRNQIDYKNLNNLFGTDYNSNVKIVFNDPNDWRYNLASGNERAYGIEFSFRRDLEKLSMWFTYAYTRHKLQFPDINNGAQILSRFDRPVDLNIGVNYKFDSNWSVGGQFIYGSGNPTNFTFKVYQDIVGITQLTGNERNTVRQIPYHKLNIYTRYKHKYEDGELSVLFGLNNAYNRYNTYYLYLYSDEYGNYNTRNVSLYPILPVLNCKYSF